MKRQRGKRKQQLNRKKAAWIETTITAEGT